MALKHLRLNTDIGTWLTPQNLKWPYLKFWLGTYIPPAKRASQLVQDLWGGLNLALKFSSNNFYTKNLYSLGHCFEYKSGSMSSNKFIADIQLAQFPLLNNTLVTYVEACVAGQYPVSRGLLIFVDNKSGRKLRQLAEVPSSYLGTSKGLCSQGSWAVNSSNTWSGGPGFN